MSMICDLKQLRTVFHYNATDAPDKDSLAETLYSLNIEGPLLASRSFDQLPAMFQHFQTVTPASVQSAVDKIKSNANPSRASNPSPSSSSTPNPSTTSSNAPANPQNPRPLPNTRAPSSSSTSSLTSSSNSSSSSSAASLQELFQPLSPAPAPVTKSLLSQAMANAPRPPQTVQVMIYLSYGKPLRFSVPENITTRDMIQAAIKQHSSEHRHPPLQANPAAYELRKAEQDGSVDDSMPPFVPIASVVQFGKNFCLLSKEPKDSPSPSSSNPSSSSSSNSNNSTNPSSSTGPSSSSANPSSSSSSSNAGNPSSQSAMPTLPVSVQASALPSSSTTPRGGPGIRPPLERRESVTSVGGGKVMYIVLPDGTKNGFSLQSAFTVGEVLSRVCLKRGLDPSFFYLTEPNEDLQLGASLTLLALGAEELVLRAKPGAPMMTPDVPADQEKLAFKSFLVNRVASRAMHRFTSDQVTLSFDKDRLFVERKKKKLTFNMSEVVGMAIGDKPTQFTIKFAAGKDLTYTASASDIVREIQLRLDCCMKYNNNK